MSQGEHTITEATRMMESLAKGRNLQLGMSKGADPQQLAMRTEFDMALRLFGGGEQESYGNPGMGMDSSIMSDSLMMDALSTIARLTADQQNSQLSVPHASLSATGKIKVDKPGEAAIAGALSAMFESGADGSAAIGYDRVGGTSYGKYQLASKTGTMDHFLNFLKKHEPEWAESLKSAGPANTGSKRGGMPGEWKRIAEEHPERFEALQRDFIKSTHYEPARKAVLAETGIDIDNTPAVIREVLWSTSVQHGSNGAARIFSRSIDNLKPSMAENDFNQKLISEVYSNRRNQFGSSTKRVQDAVKNRLDSEMKLAMNMLDGGVSQLV